VEVNSDKPAGQYQYIHIIFLLSSLRYMPAQLIGLLAILREYPVPALVALLRIKHSEMIAAIIRYLQSLCRCRGDQEPGYSPELITTILERIDSRRTFYSRAYQEHSQNSINRYVQDFNVRLGKIALKSLTGSDDISSEQLLAIKYHSYGIMGLFREWLFGDLPIATADLAHFQFEHTPDFLKTALHAYRYTRSGILSQSAPSQQPNP